MAQLTVTFQRDWGNARIGSTVLLPAGVAAELIRRRIAVYATTDKEPPAAKPKPRRRGPSRKKAVKKGPDNAA